jgi:hypothetical protein
MTIHYANPDETTFVGSVFEFQFEGGTIVRVYQRPDCIDDALETAAEWLLKHKLGRFVKPVYDLRCVGCEGDEDGPCDVCRTEAESGLTYTESGWLQNEEWTYRELKSDPLPNPKFERFDIVEAWYCYWNEHHAGQLSDGYRALCRVLKISTPADEATRFDGLSENGQAIYRQLCLRDGR